MRTLRQVGNHDVAAAFPSAPIDRVLEAHQHHGVNDPALLDLINVIIRGPAEQLVKEQKGSCVRLDYWGSRVFPGTPL
jgi:hypothetical protein